MSIPPQVQCPSLSKKKCDLCKHSCCKWSSRWWKATAVDSLVSVVGGHGIGHQQTALAKNSLLACFFPPQTSIVGPMVTAFTKFNNHTPIHKDTATKENRSLAGNNWGCLWHGGSRRSQHKEVKNRVTNIYMNLPYFSPLNTAPVIPPDKMHYQIRFRHCCTLLQDIRCRDSRPSQVGTTVMLPDRQFCHPNHQDWISPQTIIIKGW